MVFLFEKRSKVICRLSIEWAQDHKNVYFVGRYMTLFRTHSRKRLSCQSVSFLLFRVCNCPIRWLVWVILASYPPLPLTLAVFFDFCSECVFSCFHTTFFFLYPHCSLLNCSALTFGFGLPLMVWLGLFTGAQSITEYVHYGNYPRLFTLSCPLLQISLRFITWPDKWTTN